MGVERDAVRDRLEGSETAPDRHQEKEAQINERTNLRDEVEDIRWGLRTEIAKYDEIHKENAIQDFVPARTIAYRFNRTVVQPWQEEQQYNGASHCDHTPEFCIDEA